MFGAYNLLTLAPLILKSLTVGSRDVKEQHDD